MEDDAMKPEDVPQEWVEMAWGAYGTAAVGDMHAALAAIAPLIRRAALEEAAGVLESEVALLSKHRDAFERMNNGDSVRAITRDIENATFNAAAIRALDT
jgi:hypothetical protein